MDKKTEEMMKEVKRLVSKALEGNIGDRITKCHFCHKNLQIGTPLRFNDTQIFSCPDHTGVQEMAQRQWDAFPKLEYIWLDLKLDGENI